MPSQSFVGQNKKKLSLVLAAVIVLIAYQNCTPVRTDIGGGVTSNSTAPEPLPSLAPTVTPVASQACTYASKWKTVNDFTSPTTNVNTWASFAADSLGNIFVAGASRDDRTGQGHYLVRKSSDHGVTWVTADDVAGLGAVARRLAVDSLGNVYSVGSLNPANSAGATTLHYIVRRSSDHGATWSTIDDYVGAGAYGVGIDKVGNLFSVGTSSPDFPTNQGAFPFQHHITRRSTDQGKTWKSVDDVYGLYGYGSQFGLDRQGNLYSLGTQIDEVTNLAKLVIRRSSDGGGTWSTADSFACGFLFPGNGPNFATDSQGNIYSVSPCADSTEPNLRHYSARKSSDNGTTWGSIDTGFPAADFGVDALGSLYAVGYDPATLRFQVRKSSDGGLTWAKDDDEIAGNAASFGADSSGNIYSVGFYYDSSNVSHAIVRMRSCL